MNASVEFDVETLAPTYRISIGLPGSSNALAIAERLGLPRDVVEVARGSIEPERAHAESLLAEIQRERSAAEDARRAELLARKEAEEIRLGLEEKLDAIEEEREQILANARAEAEEELSRIRQLLAHAGRRIERQKPEAAAEKVAAAEAVAETLKPPPPSPRRRRRKGGDLILPEEIRAGRHRLGARSGALRRGAVVAGRQARGGDTPGLAAQQGAAEEGGEGAATGEERVEGAGHHHRRAASRRRRRRCRWSSTFGARSSTRCCRTSTSTWTTPSAPGLPWVRIVHGKGTGALARAVRGMLASHPLVKDYEVAPREEGGEGVTIAHLAT